MIILSRKSDGHLPFGVAQYASSFIDFIRPSDRDKIGKLNPGERAIVRVLPSADAVGYDAEIYRCHGR